MFNSPSTALLAQALNPRSRRSEGVPIRPGALPGRPANDPVPDNVIDHFFEPRPDFRQRPFGEGGPANDMPSAPVSRAFPEQMIGEGPLEPLNNQAPIRPPGPQDAPMPREPWNQPIDWDTVPTQPNEIGGPPGLIMPWVQNVGGFGGSQPGHPMEGIGQPPMDQGGGLSGAEIPSTSDGTAGAEVRDSGFEPPPTQMDQGGMFGQGDQDPMSGLIDFLNSIGMGGGPPGSILTGRPLEMD